MIRLERRAQPPSQTYQLRPFGGYRVGINFHRTSCPKRTNCGMTMSENGELDCKGSKIITRWNSITKPATGPFQYAMCASTDVSLSPYAPLGSIAGRSVRRERRNVRTLPSIPRRVPLRRLVIDRACVVALKAPQTLAHGGAHRTPFRVRWLSLQTARSMAKRSMRWPSVSG